MKKLNLEKINELLKETKGIKNKAVKEFQTFLEKKKKQLESKSTTTGATAAPGDTAKPIVILSTQRQIESNKKRSVFMTRVWRYVKLLLDTYPELREKFTARQLFLLYFARRRGEDVEIGEVQWQNPSLPK